MSNKATLTIKHLLHRQIAAIPEDSPVRPRVRALLKAVEELATKREGEGDTIVLLRTDVEDALQNKLGQKLSASNFGNLITKLKTDGILVANPEEEDKARPRHHTFATITPYLIGKEPKPKKRGKYITATGLDETKKTLAKEKGGLTFAQDDIDQYNIQDWYYNGLLDSVMPVHPTKTGRAMESEIDFGHYPLGLFSSSGREGELMALTDQRLARPLLTYCRFTVKDRLKIAAANGAQVPNLFVVDEKDLCRIMGIKSTKANANNACAMLERIGSTSFRINASGNPVFQRVASYDRDMPADEIRMQLISFDRAKSDNGRVYYLSLDPRIFTAMLSSKTTKTLFRAHKSLNSERSGVVQAFHNWVRRNATAGRKNKLWDNPVTMREIHAGTLADMDYKNYSKDLISGMAKWMTFESDTEEHFKLHGIEVRRNMTKVPHKYACRVDPQDPVLGDEIRQLAAQKEKERREKRKEILGDWKLSEKGWQDLLNAGASEIFVVNTLERFDPTIYNCKTHAALETRFMDYAMKGLKMEQKKQSTAPSTNQRSTRDISLEEDLYSTSWAEIDPFQEARDRMAATQEQADNDVLNADYEVVEE